MAPAPVSGGQVVSASWATRAWRAVDSDHTIDLQHIHQPRMLCCTVTAKQASVQDIAHIAGPWAQQKQSHEVDQKYKKWSKLTTSCTTSNKHPCGVVSRAYDTLS